jgi:hypothetical protein
MMEDIINSGKPTGKYNLSMHSYTELVNKIAMEDIMVHHRSSIVWDLIEQTYSRTKDLYANVELSFRKILEEEGQLYKAGLNPYQINARLEDYFDDDDTA